MTKIGAHIAYISVITVLLVALAFIIKSHNETQPNEEVIRQRDTVVVKVTDTLETEKPVPVYSKVVEEKIIYVHDTVFVSIPISEYRFYEKGKYDIIARCSTYISKGVSAKHCKGNNQYGYQGNI